METGKAPQAQRQYRHWDARRRDAKPFTPKKPVRSFRDLEVYQKTLECSVIIAKDLQPRLKDVEFRFLDNLVDCSLAIPMSISVAHSLRFANYAQAIGLLERAMALCNKATVYLEQALGTHGDRIDRDLVEDLMRRYTYVRTKIFRLEKAWQKYIEPGEYRKGQVIKKF